MVDFSIEVYGYIPLTSEHVILISETTVATWVIMAAMLIFAVVVRIKSRKWVATGKPTGLQNLVELLVDTFQGFFRGSASAKIDYLAPWFFTLLVFLMLSNLIGVIGFTGLRNPTADWSVTFPLALTTFVLIQYVGLRYRPRAYIKGLMQPVFLFFPINVIGEFSKAISLSFRLYGNILAGLILMSLLYTLAPLAIRLIAPVPLHMYFDIAAGALQAFIFTVLSMTFVGLAAED